MDQVAPYSQPGSLPTAELLQGWFEEHVDFPEATHRPGDNTCLTAAPPRRFLTSCRGLQPPELGLGLPGSHAAGQAGRRGTRAKARTWHRSKSVRASNGQARPADSSCQRSRVTQQPGNGA